MPYINQVRDNEDKAVAKTKYQATDSRGKVHTRSTESRTYTHVVVVHHKPYVWNGREYPARDTAEWAGRRELAEANAGRWRNYASRRESIEGIEVIEVTEVR